MKNYIDWSEELSVGIEEIDEQHKILVGLLNRLYEAIIKKTDKDEMSVILNELAQYTVIHFSVEESLMRIFDYPHYEDHKKHHQELTKQVLELQKKFSQGKVSISMEVLHFLRHWLTEHIMGDDKRYGPYMVERGLKQSWGKRSSWVGKIWDSMHLSHK